GTSMLQMGNIVKNPKIWIPAILASAVTGPVSTCIFKLEMNGAAVSSGMGTCGLVGPIGVWSGWANPTNGAPAVAPGAFEWLGLLLVSIVLPAVLAWLFGMLCRRLGWIKDGDMKLS
ncbi:MAG: PTS sugar transporter subunit IIC, partial [Oscillospiraceae bacterium]|nr:PTS sugar transporter subunit IIC [Oscillospiraceae bacterium]